MADRKALEFIQRTEQDPELRSRVQAIVVDDRHRAYAELAKIAESAGYAVTATALESALRECAPSALSDGELDSVTGGGIAPCTVNRTSYSVATVQTSAFSGFFSVNEHSGINPCT